MSSVKCKSCEGFGFLRQRHDNGFHETRTCFPCKGTGYIEDHPVPSPRSVADKVTTSKAYLEWLQSVEAAARNLINYGMRNNGQHLCVIEKQDRSDPHYRLCTVLEESPNGMPEDQE